ncbi:fibrillarin [archaeon]|nr:fibrillarin [archaeon]|tara:strand:- start:1970 stop:2641 length:672 start_codon:yes stop_codon:yes gene_type:complete
MLKSNYNGIYFQWQGKKKLVLTKNLTPKIKFFKEDLILEDNTEYRIFEPGRSKYSAAILQKISKLPIKENDSILYLGASHGYTCSYLSDIIGNKGYIFAVDLSPRVVRDLVKVSSVRENIIPLLFDANKPFLYKEKITKVDILYQDIAQRNQVDIFLKNVDLFLKNNGYCILCIKSRSIDVTKNPGEIYSYVRKQLAKKLKILDSKTLDPFQKDHCFFVCQKK